MTSGRSQQQLFSLLTAQLGQDPAAVVINAMREQMARHDAVDGMLLLLEELKEQAPKAAKSAIDALTEIHRRGVLAEALPWLDLGVAIASDSGALALKFFKESPLLLGLLEPSMRRIVLEIGLELADRSANVAMEFVRIAPEVVGALPPHEWPMWMEFSCELAETDFTLAIEYIRQI
ncbi:MAG TPA: hypothetical protein VM842_06565, partial [Nitrospira sp.]|nr:hypothetical protein [Nitrospira sp.]